MGEALSSLMTAALNDNTLTSLDGVDSHLSDMPERTCDRARFYNYADRISQEDAEKSGSVRLTGSGAS